MGSAALTPLAVCGAFLLGVPFLRRQLAPGTGPRIGTPRQIFLTTAVMPIPMIPNQLIPKQRRRVIAVCKFGRPNARRGMYDRLSRPD